jgi:hypothetical protein
VGMVTEYNNMPRRIWEARDNIAKVWTRRLENNGCFRLGSSDNKLWRAAGNLGRFQEQGLGISTGGE